MSRYNRERRYDAKKKHTGELDALNEKHEAGRQEAEKAKAVKSALIEAGANPKYADKMVKDFDLSALTLNDGKIKDFEKALEPVKASWSDDFGVVKVKGAEIGNSSNSGAEETNAELEAQIFKQFGLETGKKGG